MSIYLTDELVAEALFVGSGILDAAARHLSDRLGRTISRSTLAQHVESSRVLQVVRQVAKERAFDRAIAAGRERRRQRRSAAMKAAWARRRGQTNVADHLEHVDASNARAGARGSSGLKALVQQERDRSLCCARTRKGFPCVRRVVPGKRRCPNHGGMSTGPKTAAGKARIAAAQRARWQRWREERTQ
jgi:hypothetical protein